MPADSLHGPAAGPTGVRLTTTLAAARTAAWLSRHVTGGTGRTIAGRTLLALDPDAPDQLTAGRNVTLVSGTNGKTTTTAMLTAALRTRFTTASNADGANTPAGMVSALAADRAGHAVLEVDEGWLPWAVERLRPSRVVLLNLSRDQLHRHPEVHRLAAEWRHALRNVPLVVANADDPAVAWAAATARSLIWVGAGQDWLQDSMSCPACGGLLTRTDGIWACGCGCRRPTPVWSTTGGILRHHGQEIHLSLGVPGGVNLGNAALAVAAASATGVEPDAAARGTGTVHDIAGRYGRVRYRDQQVRLLLAKNPAGWDAALQTVSPSSVPLVVVFNAEGVDGRDPSWLYDVDFGRLAGRPIAVTGRRGTDIFVRLRMAGLSPVGQFDTVAGALRALPDGPVDLVANYTAFQESRRALHAA
ncbi:MAG: MurT ligase domain-containing protein [Marmoricola sp.]